MGVAMNKKYIVRLSADERLELFETIDCAQTPKTVRKRCNILLLADSSLGQPLIQAEIATRCGVSDVCVYQTVKDYCIKGLAYVLRRRQHKEPPRRPVVSGEDEARIIALACGEPPEGFSRWTVRLLTERIVELKIVPSIGRETVRTTLKKRKLSLT
jgi:transposase